MQLNVSVYRAALLATSALAVMMGCASVDTSTQANTSAQGKAETAAAPGAVSGYLPRTALPNSAALLPPPPAPGSAAFAADEQVYRDTRALRDTPRWAQAVRDVDLSFPNAAGTFTCAVGAPITEKDTPRLYMLLRRSLWDGALATYPAKTQHQRTRPFAAYKETSCSPQDQPRLEKDGSYPSGHSAIGWAWALLFTQLAPDRADAILQRGYSFGQSRVICGVHWQSDVAAGRVVAAGVVARLQADPAFTADLEAAGKELAAVRKKELQPTRDCSVETQGPN